MAQKNVGVVQALVRCSVGITEEFKVEVGLHQGSFVVVFYTSESSSRNNSVSFPLRVLLLTQFCP